MFIISFISSLLIVQLGKVAGIVRLEAHGADIVSSADAVASLLGGEVRLFYCT